MKADVPSHKVLRRNVVMPAVSVGVQYVTFRVRRAPGACCLAGPGALAPVCTVYQRLSKETPWYQNPLA